MNSKWIFVLMTLAFIGCNQASKPEKKPEESTRRIVCLAKQYNEIIFALDAEKELVGRDLSSTYPPEIKDITSVGYHRALGTEGILSLKPDLIIHDNNVGPEQVMNQLNALQIPMHVFGSDSGTIEGTQRLIREMGRYFEQEKNAEMLCAKLESDMQKALANAANLSDTPTVVIIHFGRASNVYLTVTANSTAGKMINWAGGKMAIDGERGMKRLTSPELIAQANPDIILLTDFGYDRLGTAEAINQLPGVSETKAAKSGRIYRVEEHDLIYLGPRTGENVLMLQEILHPKV